MKIGDIAALKVDAFGDKEVSGRISKIYPEITQKSKMIKIEISIPYVKELKKGMFVRDEVRVAEHVDMLAVPMKSVVKYLVQTGNAKLIEIKIGLLNNQYFEVTEGLN